MANDAGCSFGVTLLTRPSSRTNGALVANLVVVAAIIATIAIANDEKHKEFLKNFVPNHPHLHELVDMTHKGDTDAKSRYERESLSVRYNQTRDRVPENTDKPHVLLHFLDDYNSHMTGEENSHKFMDLEPFIEMLSKEGDLSQKLIELGELIEKAECDLECLGTNMTDFMNVSVMRMMHDEL